MSHFQNPDYCRTVREATEKTIRLAHQRGSSSVVRQPAQDVIDDCNLMLGAIDEIDRLRQLLSQVAHAAKYLHHEVCLARDRREIRGGWWDKACQQVMDAVARIEGVT